MKNVQNSVVRHQKFNTYSNIWRNFVKCLILL